MITELFSKDYTGGAFVLFGPGHLLFLAGFVLVILLLPRLRGISAVTQRRIRVGYTIWLLLNELAIHAWKAWIGEWSAQTMLPLHLCSVFVILNSVMMLSTSRRLTQGIFEYAYFLGVGGAVQALITPEAGIYGLPHFRAWQALIAHSLIVLGPLYLAIVEGYRPYWRSILRVMVGTNLYMLVMFGVNSLLGSNYLYIMRKPDTASLIDVMPGWPWYILVIEALGVALCVLLYLPFAISDWRRRGSKAAVVQA